MELRLFFLIPMWALFYLHKKLLSENELWFYPQKESEEYRKGKPKVNPAQKSNVKRDRSNECFFHNTNLSNDHERKNNIESRKNNQKYSKDHKEKVSPKEACHKVIVH